MSDVKILHHGAVTGVTGSCHELFFTDSNSVLIDCGMFQGAEASGRELGDSTIDFYDRNHLFILLDEFNQSAYKSHLKSGYPPNPNTNLFQLGN